jgi:thiamine transport system substrate-binding protein
MRPLRCSPLLGAILAVVTLAACSSGGGSSDHTLTLVTHDSFAVSRPVLRTFTQETGWKVRILKNGDAGQMLNQVILTKNAPLGDALFGVDNTFLTRALDAKVYAKYRPPAVSTVDPALDLDHSGHATPVDFGDVCINVDTKYFAPGAGHGAAPSSLDDLTEPRFKDQLVVENPATSSTGLAFVAATVARYGDTWLDYWDRLKANGVLAVNGWDQAYENEFSGSSSHRGTRPIVVSYASSPPAEIYFAKRPPATPPTASVDRTCFRQVEFVGVLKGAAHPAAARKLVNFMLTQRFQRDVPLQMFVYPAVTGTPLPEVFTRYSTVAQRPYTLSPARIGAQRRQWIDQWTEHVLR